MRNFIICEKQSENKAVMVKGMTFNGYEAALKTCIRLSTIHKDKDYIVYDKVNQVQYSIEKVQNPIDVVKK